MCAFRPSHYKQQYHSCGDFFYVAISPSGRVFAVKGNTVQARSKVSNPRQTVMLSNVMVV